jgi:hypothetical protein
MIAGLNREGGGWVGLEIGMEERMCLGPHVSINPPQNSHADDVGQNDDDVKRADADDFYFSLRRISVMSASSPSRKRDRQDPLLTLPQPSGMITFTRPTTPFVRRTFMPWG